VKFSALFPAVTVVVLSALVAPERANAQASRAGASFNIPVIGSTLKRYPDVAYSTANDVYLVVHGNGFGGVGGAFVSQDGAVVGAPFQISQTGAFTQTPRVTYSPTANVFLVTWLDTRANANLSAVWGSIVAFNGGSPAVAGNFQIAGAPGGVHSEMGAASAFSTTSGVFLAAWMQYGPANGRFDVRAQRIGTNGGLVGGEITLTADNDWQAQPTVAYNPSTDQFLVAYGGEAGGAAYIRGKLVQASTGAVAGGDIGFAAGSYLTVPEAQYVAGTGQYMVGWYSGSPSPVFYARLVNADGSLSGNIFPLVAGYGSYDGFDLEYNPVSNTLLAVFHDNFSAENIGVQVSPTGTPDAPFAATGSGGTGNFNPRLAANLERSEWFIATARSFAQVIGQRVSSATRAGGTPAPTPTPTPAPSPAPTTAIDLASAPNGSWFFAEGAGGGNAGFDTYYLIANPHEVPVTVRAYFATESGVATEKSFTVDATSRRTIRLGDQVAPGSYGAVFQSTTAGRQVFVERNVFWSGYEGSAGSAGVAQASQTWYFAEGSRLHRFFQNFFQVFNPSSTQTANVTLTFFGSSGTLATKTYIVPRQGRITVDANSLPEFGDIDFSTRVTSDVPVVAERSMFWNGDWRGGTNTFGAANTSPFWYFAEGVSANNIDTYYTILNPNSFGVTVGATYFLESGPASPRFYTVPANSRFTINLASELGRVGAVGSQFGAAAGAPIVMERSIYWGRNWVEGSNVVGVTAGAGTWHLPEGTAASGFDTYTLVANPNANTVTVRVTVLVENGQRIVQDYNVGAYSRLTLHMNAFSSLVAGRSFSTSVQSLAGGNVVVEHAVYGTPAGVDYWRSGSASFGIPQ